MADLERRFGAKSTELAAIPHVMTTSLAAELDALRSGTWSRYWELPDDLRHHVADSIEGELRDACADLAEPLDIKLSLTVLMATQLGL